MKTIHKNLAALSSLCGEEARYSLDAVRLTTPDLEYTAEATNSKIALHVVGGIDVDDTPDPRGGTEAFIDAKTWKSVFSKAAKDRHCTAVAVSLGDKDVEFISGQNTTKTMPVEGRYPDISAVTPKGSPVATVRLNAGLLLTLVKAIKDIAGEDEAITVKIYGEKRPVILHTKTETQKLTGLIAAC